MKIERYIAQSVLFAVASSYDRIWRDFNSRLKREKCNFLEAMILIALFVDERATVTPSALARNFKTTPGNVSHGVSRLQKRGLLVRALSEDDARSYRLVLKPEGKRLALRLIRIIDSTERLFEQDLGRDRVMGTIKRIAELEESYLRSRSRS